MNTSRRTRCRTSLTMLAPPSSPSLQRNRYLVRNQVVSLPVRCRSSSISFPSRYSYVVAKTPADFTLGGSSFLRNYFDPLLSHSDFSSSKVDIKKRQIIAGRVPKSHRFSHISIE